MPTARTMLRALVPVGIALAILAPPRVAAAEPTVAELQEKIRTSSAELERVVEDYNTTNVQLTRSTAEAAEASARLTALRGQLDAGLATVGDIARDAYKRGELTVLGALLTSGSSDALMDRVTALDQVARHRNGEVAAVAAARTRVEEQKRALDALVATQTAQRKDLATRKTKIEKDLDELYALRERAFGARTETSTAAPAPSTGGGSGSSGGSTATKPPPASGKGGIAVNFAHGALGKPYVWAAAGPNGYDCSGLTLAAWRAAGVKLDHSSSIQYSQTARISRAQLQPGDLVFYNGLGHVAIFIGGGKVIHAPTFGEVVKISSVDMMTPNGYGRPG